MAAVGYEVTNENSIKGTAYETETLEKIRAELTEEQNALVTDIDLTRIIRGYCKEAPEVKWTVTWDHVMLFIAICERGLWTKFKEVPEGINMSEVERFQKALPLTVYGQDKQGHPVVYEDVRNFDIDAVKDVASDDVNLAFSRDLMTAEIFCKTREQSASRDIIMYKHVRVIDVYNLGIFSVRTYKDIIQKTIDRESNLYAENLHKLFIINGGWAFRAIWSIVKLFVHADTQTKVNIVGSNYLSEIQKDIDNDQIPKVYGGNGAKKLDWKNATFYGEEVEAQN